MVDTAAGYGVEADRISAELDSTFEELVEDTRAREPQRFSRRERLASVSIGGAFLLTALAMAAVLPRSGSPSLVVVAVFVGAYAVLSRVEFEVGSGSAVPTQLVLVPLVFAVPAPLVPLFVAGALVLSDLLDVARGTKHPERLFVALCSSWHAVGASLVLALFASSEPTWDDWPVYVAALSAQFAFDAAASTTREWLALDVSPRLVLRYLGWVFLVDALLAPVGLLIAFAHVDVAFAALFPLSLAALLALLAHERRQRIESALELARAYRRANGEARRDALTELGNRLAWEEALQREEATRGRSGRPASVIVLDVNGLKRANDLHGHHFGDELIREVAAAVRAAVREIDVVARVGGDEIAVLMPDTGEEACAQAVARLTAVLAGHPGVNGFPLSASVGYAACPPGATLDEAQQIADARMYERKQRSGSARVSVA